MNDLPMIHSYITVKGDEMLEKAIASEVTSLNESDITRDFLEEMSTQYTPTPGKKKTVVENLDEQDSSGS